MPSVLARVAFAHPLAALLVTAGLAGAAVAVTYTSASTLTTGVTAAPVELEAGAGLANTRYFDAGALTANKTTLGGTLKARAGADLVVKDVVRVANRAGSAQSVTLAADPVSNARVEVLGLTVRNGGSVVGTLDYRAASPSVSFTLPASTTYVLDLRVDLADGAGANNAQLPLALRLVVG